MSELNKQVIRNFWRERSSQPTNRWTDEGMLNFELSYLNVVLREFQEPISILDLGSGAGQLSKGIQRIGDNLTAVDFEEPYQRHFELGRNQVFCAAEVTQFKSLLQFDLILLFGVVTHLTKMEEERIFLNISNFLATNGVAVIKHQVSLKNEVIVNQFSPALNSNYSARYPTLMDQESKLKDLFRDVSILRYPAEFNKFKDTIHASFVVKNPIRY